MHLRDDEGRLMLCHNKDDYNVFLCDIMRILKCEKCGFPYNPETNGARCPHCGWIIGREKIEVVNHAGRITRKVRLQSDSDVYYRYNPDIPPFREDAWGKYYIGNCYSKKDSVFIKKVTICKISGSPTDGFAYAMWKLLRDAHLDFNKTALIPIIDFIDTGSRSNYLIEEYFSGVSLYDLMHGQVSGNDGQTIGFAVKMYDIYQNNRVDFAKIVTKEVLKTAKFMHDHGIGVNYIEPPENIIFTEDGEIKIRMINSLDGYKTYCSIPFFLWETTFSIEYASPEHFEYERFYKIKRFDERPIVYSVGMFMFCIMKGHLPYKGATSLDDCHLVHSREFDLYDDSERKTHLVIPRFNDILLLAEIGNLHLRKIIERATKVDPNKRYQSITEFINALDDNEETAYYNAEEEKNNRPSPWYKKMFMSISNVQKNRLVRFLIFLLLLAVYICTKLTAQTHMRIHHKGGGHSDLPIEQIDSITFVDGDEGQAEGSELMDGWLWGDMEAGYYELLTFNDDNTYTGYDNYFTYGFDTMTYGLYFRYGNLLTLQSNGFGYNRKYTWYVMGLTENALDVMTKMGRFTYYKLQPETYSIKVGEESYACKDGDYYVFCDGVKVLVNEGKLKGLSEGITYILKYYAESGLIMAYKVIVEK